MNLKQFFSKNVHERELAKYSYWCWFQLKEPVCDIKAEYWQAADGLSGNEWVVFMSGA